MAYKIINSKAVVANFATVQIKNVSYIQEDIYEFVEDSDEMQCSGDSSHYSGCEEE